MQYISFNSAVYTSDFERPELKKEVNYLLSKLKNKLPDFESLNIYKHSFKASLLTADNETVELDLQKYQAVIKRIFAHSNSRESITLTRDRISEMMKRLALDEGSTLYLWSSGGGGHKSAKDANLEKDVCLLRDKILHSVPEELRHAVNVRVADTNSFTDWCRQMGVVKEADVLAEYLGTVGKKCADAWDAAQKAGDVKKQEKLASWQKVSDLLFGPVVFFQTLKDLIRLNPKRVVSTQAMSTAFILLAIIVYNVLFKPLRDHTVTLHLYMTDMPTKLSSHFFNSLKIAPSYYGKKYVLLHAPKPTDSDTWESRCGLQEQDVKVLDTNEFPVRPSFLKAVAKAQSDGPGPIRIKTSGKDEEELLQKTLLHQGSHALLTGCDEAYFLMLGSQPTEHAVKDYVDTFLKKAQANPATQYQLFAFAGKFTKEAPCFYKELCKHIQKVPDWPSNLQVVPLSFQDAEHIVSLELNCHTITRSGGATVMELLVLSQILERQKKRLVHAQKIDSRTLVDSIPLWEKGNFFYLQDAVGKERCQVVDPAELFS